MVIARSARHFRAAPGGAVIRVCAGRYDGNIEIDKVVRLVADGARSSVRITTRRGGVVTVRAEAGKLTGLVLVEMGAFLASNSGLTARFSLHVTLENYTADELVKIVERHAAAVGYECTVYKGSVAPALRRLSPGRT